MQLFALAISIRWIISVLEVPLRERQFWATVVMILATTSVTWLLLRLTPGASDTFAGASTRRTAGEMAAMLRLARRAAEVLVIAAAVLVMLHYFGLDPTAALAGLGIGGIAVALAAQKTLENVIGGLSIMFDKAVRVGDFLEGRRDDRHGRLHRPPLDPDPDARSHHRQRAERPDREREHRNAVGARQVLVSSFRRACATRRRPPRCARSSTACATCSPAIPASIPAPIRARFFRLGPFSLDIEVFAYIVAGDWDGRFSRTSRTCCFDVMEIVEREGTAIALPSQRLTLADARSAASLPR